MDRRAIERRDFPVGRRGYDQAAVDEHLRQVADRIESLRGAGPALSAGTAEQVRLILEAAEDSAAQLRKDAGRQASGHVARVEEAAEGMLGQLAEVERELGDLLGTLRASGERLTEGLARLHAQAGDVGVPQEPEPPADEPPAPAPAALDGDEAGARLIALNMALSGKPREETAAYLAEHFPLPDPGALLDDVYARAGG